MLVPANELGDGAFPYLVKNIIGGWISLPILLAITAAIHSTTDGLLHIVGLYFAKDVFQPLRPHIDEAGLLRISRKATFVFGATVTGVAAYVSTHPITLISLIAAVAWGGMASTLFCPTIFRPVLAESDPSRCSCECCWGASMLNHCFYPQPCRADNASRNLPGCYSFADTHGCRIFSYEEKILKTH